MLDVWNGASGQNDVSLDAAVRRSWAPDEIRSALKRSQRSDFGADALLRRFEHFLEESQVLVPAAVDAIAARDEGKLGEIVDRSQHGAERLLGNQVPETVALARSARERGAIAASAFGAGFGGSVWALVRRSEANQFLSDWRTEYARAFPDSSETVRVLCHRRGPRPDEHVD